MRQIRVPAALHRELSTPVVEGIAEMVVEANAVAAERFDRRLAEETGKLRLDFAEMKHELLKWSFLFWLGQVAVLGSLVSLFLRLR